MNVYLLRYGEIHLKGKNRGMFERVLIDNLRSALKDIKCTVSRIAGRYLISDFDDNKSKLIEEKIKKVFGFVSFSRAEEIESDYNLIEEKVAKLEIGNKTFKVFVNRADKTFPVRSNDFAAHLGGIILDNNPAAKVNLTTPEVTVEIDIRENKKAYISFEHINAAGGLPVGTSSKGLLMLSGGIDSPVAGHMMCKRGMKLSFIHFYSFPYTSEAAKQKVVSLAKILTGYNGKSELYLVPFTKIQEEIHKNCSPDYMIALMRRIMIRISEKVCRFNSLKAIITGENLGQVASQTVESMTSTGDVTKMPIFRPLIGFDKTEIIQRALEIGSFETSILPYEDCCTVFLPDKPVIKPSLRDVERQESYLDIESLVNIAVSEITKIVF